MNNVSKIYSSEERTVRALDEANLTITDREFVLIVGRSGSGKSTLLSILGGLTRPTSGTVLFNDRDIWTLSDAELSDLRSREMGFVFQFAGLLPTLTSIENVMLPCLFSKKDEKVHDRAATLLTSFGLSEKFDSYPHQLSGGEMKRVSIARALINDPGVILADEPTGDLDADTEREIMEYFKMINKDGKIVIMVTHNPELSVFASRILRMSSGKIYPIE